MKLGRLSDLALIGILLCLAALPRLALLERQPLWVDEAFSLAIATGHSLEHPAAEARAELGDYIEPPRPVRPAVFRRYLRHDEPPAGPARVVRAVFLSDTSPPLYYLLLWAWTLAFGTGDAALRLFSVTWSLACLPLLWSLGKAAAGRWAAGTACLLFAFAPVALYYSTDGRMYALLWFFACLTAWATLRLAALGFRWPVAFLWVVAGTAGLLTHYFFGFVWAAFAGWLLLRPGKLPRAFPVMGSGAAALLALPWLVRVPESLSRWRVTQGWLDSFPSWSEVLLALLKLPWSFYSTRGHWGNPLWTELPAVAVFAALGLSLLATGAWRRLPRSESLLVAVWFLAACLGPVAFDLLMDSRTQTVTRYALAGLPAAVLLAAAAIASLRPFFRRVFPVLVLAAWSPGIWDVFHNEARHGHTFRKTAAVLDAWARPGDLVIVHSIPSGVLGIARYLGDGPEMVSWVEQLGRRSVPRDVAAFTAGRPHVALVEVHKVGSPVPEEAWLRSNAELTAERRLHAARLLFFGPTGRGGRSGSVLRETTRTAPTAPGTRVPPARNSER